MKLTQDGNWKKFSKKFLECHKVCAICGGSKNIYCSDCKHLVMKDKELMKASCKHPDCNTPFMRNKWYDDEVEISFGDPMFMNRHNNCKYYETNMYEKMEKEMEEKENEK